MTAPVLLPLLSSFSTDNPPTNPSRFATQEKKKEKKKRAMQEKLLSFDNEDGEEG